MDKYQVISEESATLGKVLFEGNLDDCYAYRKMYSWSVYPSISMVK